MELEQVIRQIYRVPIANNDEVNVSVDGSEYEVVNLGSQGIGIRLSEPVPFRVDGRNHEIDLRIEGNLLHLSGEIVHVTPYDADNYLCGIKLIDMDEESHRRLLGCVYRIRADLFTKG